MDKRDRTLHFAESQLFVETTSARFTYQADPFDPVFPQLFHQSSDDPCADTPAPIIRQHGHILDIGVTDPIAENAAHTDHVLPAEGADKTVGAGGNAIHKFRIFVIFGGPPAGGLIKPDHLLAVRVVDWTDLDLVGQRLRMPVAGACRYHAIDVPQCAVCSLSPQSNRRQTRLPGGVRRTCN